MNISTVEGEFITSGDENVKWDDHVIETWYEESKASANAWGAFVKGHGTRYGSSREEAIKNVKEKVKNG